MMIWQFRFEPQENNEPFLIIYLVSWLQGIGISLPDYHCTSASLRSLAGMGQVRAAM